MACPFQSGSKNTLKVSPGIEKFLCRRCSGDGDGGNMDAATFKRHAEYLGIWEARGGGAGGEGEHYLVRDAGGSIVAIQKRYRKGDGSKVTPWFRLPATADPLADMPKLDNLIANLGGRKTATLPLYLTEKIATYDMRRPIFICEGGKAAAAAFERHGLQALGTMTGASGTPHADVLAVLSGADRVVGWPDRDEIGCRHVARYLARCPEGPKLCAVDPAKLSGLPDTKGADAADWRPPAGSDPAALLEATIVPLAEFAARAGTDAGEAAKPKGDGFPAEVSAALRPLATVEIGGLEAAFAQVNAAVAAVKASSLMVDLVRAAAVEALRKRRIARAREIVGGAIVQPANGDGAGGSASGTGIRWPEVKAAEEPQTTADVLAEVERHLRRFVAWPAGGAVAVATWIVWSWVSEHSYILPILALLSPVKRCGKTTAMDVIRCFLDRPFPAVNATAPALFRLIESERPILLLDEVDLWLQQDQGGDRHQILNAGYRRGTPVPRCVGDEHEVRTFAIDAPKVLAGIGELKDTLADRSVTITLERAAPGDRLEGFRQERNPDPALRGRLLRWAEDHGAAFANLDPDMGELTNRAADNWRPLFAVAEMAGGKWPAAIREAAGGLIDRAEKRASVDLWPEMLLADVREVFAAQGDPLSMTGRDLDEALHGMTERPWATCSRGKPLSAQLRGRWLARFGVQSQTLHGAFAGADAKGYERASLEPAWARYLSGGPLGEARTVRTVRNTENIGDFGNAEPSGGASSGRFNGSGNVNESGAPDGSDGSTPPYVPGDAFRAPDPQPAGGVGELPAAPLTVEEIGELGGPSPASGLADDRVPSVRLRATMRETIERGLLPWTGTAADAAAVSCGQHRGLLDRLGTVYDDPAAFAVMEARLKALAASGGILPARPGQTVIGRLTNDQGGNLEAWPMSLVMAALGIGGG